MAGSVSVMVTHHYVMRTWTIALFEEEYLRKKLSWGFWELWPDPEELFHMWVFFNGLLWLKLGWAQRVDLNECHRPSGSDGHDKHGSSRSDHPADGTFGWSSLFNQRRKSLSSATLSNHKWRCRGLPPQWPPLAVTENLMNVEMQFSLLSPL